MNKELSGDTIVTIGGVPQILYSRYWPTPGNVKAAQYVYEKLQSYGYNPKYQVNNSTCVNVYTEKTGSKYPGRKYIISAHYDDITNPLPLNTDTIHGSDDNASGVCAVLEAARLLAGYNCDYTVVFVLFDEEELLPYNGSKAFADSAYFRGDSILGVINMDMIAYNINNDSLFFLYTNENSMNLTNDFAGCLQIYKLNLNLYKFLTNTNGSDQLNFWARNYKAISGQEYHLSPYWHKKEDKFDKIDMAYF
jgi:Zn-dependent M28 family amino/carboxypeptidase